MAACTAMFMAEKTTAGPERAAYCCQLQTSTEAWCQTWRRLSGLRWATRKAESKSSAAFESTKSHSHRPAAPLPRPVSGAAQSVPTRPSECSATASVGSTRVAAISEKMERAAFQHTRKRETAGGRVRMCAVPRASANK